MPRHLIEGLGRFRRETFPRYRERYRRLVEEGQRPGTLFIGCSDSRIVPELLMGTGPGELFIVRNMGAFVPPFEPDRGYHGTSAGIEYAVLTLGVTDIVVCGHTHCGAIDALYRRPDPSTPHVQRWLELGWEARVGPAEDAKQEDGEQEDGEQGEGSAGRGRLRRTEERSVAVQLGRLLSYPMVREAVGAGSLSLHGWLYVIEEGQVLALDVETGGYLPLVAD